jgi:hypothetical protein
LNLVRALIQRYLDKDTEISILVDHRLTHIQHIATLLAQDL